MKIALVSQNIKWQDFDANIAKILNFAQIAKDNGAELAIFPEMAITGFCNDNSNFFDLSKVLDAVKTPPIDIVFGAGIKENNKFYNKLLWIDKNAKLVANFDKLHAFRFGLEKDIELGNSFAIHNFNYINFGFGICYDLRFFETFAKVAQECEIFIVPACWPKSRVYEWKTLLKARALENQAIFLGVNRTGKEPNLEYTKSSIAVLPNGREIKPVFSKNEIAIYDININEVREKS